MNNLYINKFNRKTNIIRDPYFISYYKNYLPKDFDFENFTVIGEGCFILMKKNNKYNKIHIESNCKNCYICKKNIDYNKKIKIYDLLKKKYNKLNDCILYKIKNLIKDNNRLFIYKTIVNDSSQNYLKYYYHLCKECYEFILYYSYKIWNKYPENSYEGNYIIKKYDKIVPEIKSKKTLNIIKNINFPNIYECDVHAGKIYKFLNNKIN